jgi:cell division protein FtsB
MKYAIVIIVLVVLAYLVMAFNSRTEELNRLNLEQEAVQTQLESRQQTKAAIEAQIEFATSEAAVREWAYKNHMAQPGDQVVIPIAPAESTPTPQLAEPQTQPSSQPNWQRWLVLFIDPGTANSP